ncbi:MAG: peptide deformylase [Endomicrobium sp.]|nr:peptide deformylase [Endomicrobium sp.]
MKTSGLEAIVIQHEIDHLDGKVFSSIVKNGCV